MAKVVEMTWNVKTKHQIKLESLILSFFDLRSNCDELVLHHDQTKYLEIYFAKPANCE